MESKENFNYSKIFLEDSLYSEYDMLEMSMESIMNILFFHERAAMAQGLKTLDSYCIKCKKETTFICEETDGHVVSDLINNVGFYFEHEHVTIQKLTNELEKIGTFQKRFKCPRPESNSSHDQIFLFQVIDSKLKKIGQSPAIADLAKIEIDKYRKVGDNVYQELNRAIGLASHGIGVGSYVYLRRIIEKHIVLPRLQELIQENKITAEELFHLDFKDKVLLAKDKLPVFLVENKKIYSILSKGIHQLEEKECHDFFPVLRASIEMILDEEIEKKERESKINLIANKISKFS